MWEKSAILLRLLPAFGVVALDCIVGKFHDFYDFVVAVAESFNHMVVVFVVACACGNVSVVLLWLLPPDWIVLCVWEKFHDFVVAIAGSYYVRCGFGLCTCVCGNISMILLQLLPDHVM